ncbi:hypothetical protein [Nostoc sp. MS1]|uniref:hypothetical protein n=1 Tax=Nostoc sp. MS1 TaxID=2764711 RepID=UPI001CC73FB5|nr:hypothetical protein [Nostoc sp. MS1]
MSNRRYPSPYWRYLRARLSNLGKPSFWGTAIFLSVVGLVVHQYWTNPQVANNSNIVNNTDDSELSEEDKAIAADIDNLPSLLADTEPLILPANTSQSKKNKNQTPLTNPTNKPSSGDQPKLNSDSGIANFQQPTSVEKNVFVSEAENLLRFGATNNDQLLGYKPGNGYPSTTGVTANSSQLNPGLANQINTSQNVNSSNQQPTGLTSSTNQVPSLSNSNPTITNSTNITTYGGVTQSLPTSTQPPQTTPNTGLNPGLGYTQPSYTNNFNNVQTVPINTTVSPVTNYTQPNSYNNLNNNQVITPNTRINPGVGYVQPIIPNPPSNLNYLQNSPNQTQSTSTVITGTSSIIGPYTVRSRANNTTNTTPVVPNNYGYSQIPQANYPNNNLPQGQNINGLQNNGYSYP